MAPEDRWIACVRKDIANIILLPKAKTPHEQESLTRTIAATDAQIDALVYELYGLTDAEIRIVIGNSGSSSARLPS